MLCDSAYRIVKECFVIQSTYRSVMKECLREKCLLFCIELRKHDFAQKVIFLLLN